jgi:uracil-DNA glycosylase family 4
MKKIPIICDGTLCGHNYETVPAELVGTGFELVVCLGEAPFKDEVEKQRPFIGKAGNFLRKYLALDNYQYLLMNSIMCKPHDTIKSKPTNELIAACSSVRNKLLDMMVEGDIIVLFGRFAQMAMFDKYVKFDTMPYFIKHPTKGFEMEVWAEYHPMAPQYDRSVLPIFEDILRATGKFKV